MSAIAEQFTAIAKWIDEGRGAEGVLPLLAQARVLCEQAATSAMAKAKPELVNLQQALETWQTVWPRLGSQQEFRLAVAREARLWAKRLAHVHDPIA